MATSDFAAPIIEQYAANISPVVTSLMIGLVFPGLIGPLILTSLYLSAPRMASSLLSSLSIMLLIFGLMLSIWNGYIQVHTILSPFEPVSENTYMGAVAVACLLPCLSDFVAALQLPEIYGSGRLYSNALARTSVVFVTLARLIMIALSIASWHDILCEATCSQLSGSIPRRFLRVETILQTLTRIYVTSRLLRLRIRSSKGEVTLVGGISAILGDYVLPALCSVAQLVVVYAVDRSYTVLDVLLVDSFISILAVCFSAEFRHGLAFKGPQKLAASVGSTHLTFRNDASHQTAADTDDTYISRTLSSAGTGSNANYEGETLGSC